MKTFYEQMNVGSAKYVVNYHDGQKTHRDGSPFFDIELFRNQKAKTAFVASLKSQGYVER